MCHMWVAAVQMPSEAGEEVILMRRRCSSDKDHIVLQAYRFSLQHSPETSEKIFSKVQQEKSRKKKIMKCIPFSNKLGFLEFLYHKGTVTGPQKSTMIFNINVH